MMRRLIVIGWMGIAVACTNRGHVPGDIIQKDKMSSLLWEMIEVDQYSYQFLEKDSAKIDVHKETARLYDQVLQMHHVTRDEFEKSLTFYRNNPDISAVMFDSLYTQANRQRNKVYDRAPRPGYRFTKPPIKPAAK